MGITDTGVLEFLDDVVLTNFLFLLLMSQHLEVHLAIVLLIGQERVGIIFQGSKLILIELFFFNVVKCHNMLLLQIGYDKFLEIGFLEVDDVGRTASEIIEDIADLQVM